MEKSLFRAFIFSLVVFIGLNFLVFFTVYSSSVQVVLEMELERIAAHPSHIGYTMIYPSRFFPWQLIQLGIENSSYQFTIYYIAGFVTFILAAIVAGLMGGDIIKSFGGWILTCITYMVIHIAIVFIDEYNIFYIHFSYTAVEAIILILITGVVNMLVFGGVVILIAYIRSKD